MLAQHAVDGVRVHGPPCFLHFPVMAERPQHRPLKVRGVPGCVKIRLYALCGFGMDGERVTAAKRDKIRFVPVHPMVLRLIGEYLEAGKHGAAVSHESLDSPLFRPVANNRTGTLDKHLDPGSIYQNIVMKYAKATGISGEAIGVCVRSMRATAATNALSNEDEA
jgi:hypothetical protein